MKLYITILASALTLVLSCCGSKDNNASSGLQPSDNNKTSESIKTNNVDFRILRLDGWFEDQYDAHSNFSYQDIFDNPIVIQSTDGLNYLKENYSDFYNEREIYLKKPDLSYYNIFVFSLLLGDNYYYFLPVSMTIESDIMKIRYHLNGEEPDTIHDGSVTPKYFTTILEIPKRIDTFSQLQLISILREDYEPVKIGDSIIRV